MVGIFQPVMTVFPGCNLKMAGLQIKGSKRRVKLENMFVTPSKSRTLVKKIANFEAGTSFKLKRVPDVVIAVFIFSWQPGGIVDFGFVSAELTELIIDCGL